MTTLLRAAAALCSLALLLLLGPSRAPAQPQAPASEDDRVLALLAEDLEAQRRFNPVSASLNADRRFDDRWPDASAQGRAAIVDDARARLARLEAVDLSRLTHDNRVNAALLQYELHERIAVDATNDWQMPISQIDGPQQFLPMLADNLSFTTDEQRAAYITRLETLPAYIAQVIANMREGLKAGRTPPRVVMGAVAQQALAHATPEHEADPASHVMYKPFVGRSGELADRAKQAIAQGVIPAFRALGEFLRDEYVPGCRETIAAGDLPGGGGYYSFQIRLMTTVDLSADQIHRIGLTEVARIRAEMMRVIARSDYPRKNELKGDELFHAFIEYLRADPRFYHRTAEELLDAYRAIAKRIDADMPRLFATLPRLSYGVREMPPYIAPSSPTAYYFQGSLKNGVAGFFVANTYRLDQRPTYEMIPLTLHEAVPGHHHQIAIAQELEAAGMPEWRTELFYNAFGEGWALYAERLGFQMGDEPSPTINPAVDAPRGLYADPYADFGRLSYEMWRAMRLVVDTAIHSMGWTRDQAINYMLDNSALTRTNIEREVDRYIASPGQALGYKLGEMRIRALRADAEAALADRFDVRRFHDAVLGQGSIPLDLLSAQVQAWIDREKKRN
ncbi:MAG TPA: DUF885 domain-containing protein [Phycisphaerales bacterium]|nr:DUF885 domain-containing protein [Phycisphaerales bacterium]